MNIQASLKLVGIALLTLGVAAGCATAEKQAEKPTASQEAMKASEAAKAIADAKTAAEKANSLGYEWRDTGKIIKEAEAAAKKGDYDTAIQLANKAKAQGELAVKQYYAEQSIDRSIAPAQSSAATYTVDKGDSLWGIAGKSDVYGDPYEWPLIYKTNSSKIKDPDLIYPGQEFDIDSNPSAAQVDMAVHHAKTRGAWTVGAAEESDKAYLGEASK